MGKLIEEKYTDVNHRIIKKQKNDKGNLKLTNTRQAVTRKSSCLECEEPVAKRIRVENVGFQESTEVDFSQLVIEKDEEVSNSTIYAIPSFDGVRLQIKENKSRDLFLHDELLDSYENYTNNDFAFQILDEISLEGLDGLTIEAFWKRFNAGMHKMIDIRDDLKERIWQFICSKKHIQFFKLAEARDTLDIYDRLKYVDPDIGVVVEPAIELPDIYPFKLVNNPDVQGSCSTFDSRVDVSSNIRNLDLKTVQRKYDTTLVMTASQKLRNQSLLSDCPDPTIEVANVEYCILEKIGRSRRHGELTQGNMSIALHFNMDPKSVFHYKKQLTQYNILSKQSFLIKSVVVDQNKIGKLLHLRRFYQKMKPKHLLIAEQIINVMKNKPDYRIELSEVRRMFQEFALSLTKIIKMPEFKKFVKIVTVRYRDIYPNATKSEYMRKSIPTEKSLKCLELTNPYVNIAANWSTENDDSDNEDEVEVEVTGAKIMNMECFKDVFYHIFTKGKDGCSLQDLQKLIGVDNNTVRMCLKKLLSRKVVSIKKFDQGKQRHILYYASCLDYEDIKPNLNPESPKLSNALVKKLRAKHRSLIEKSSQAPDTPKSDKIELQDPHLTCPFFIQKTHHFLGHTDDIYFKTSFSFNQYNYLIKLNTEFPTQEQLFNINELLNGFSSDFVVKTVKTNIPTDTYTSKSNVNYITKLLLLRATFGDFIINASTLNCFSRKRQHSTVSLLCNPGKDKSKMTNDKLQYMGDAPETVFTENEGNITLEILVSTPPAEYKITDTYPGTKDLSERMLSRIGIILREVYEKKVFEELYKLNKVVEEEEFKEGYNKKIDKKSLCRILKRLMEEGYIKIFKVTISDDKITKTQTLICHPSVNHMDGIIQSACQQLKWKHFVGTSKKTTKTNVPILQKTIQEMASPFQQANVMRSVMELREMNKLKQKDLNSRFNARAATNYDYKPKFVRMRIIHELLYYLIYAYNRNTQPLQDREVYQWLSTEYHVNLTRDELKHIPKVYCKEISWKMFIPPLPYHYGWMVGWTLMCDIILRLPIIFLCNIHNVPYDIPELVDVLNHPIKRFYLVKDLSENIRNAVLLKRKYLFTIYDSIQRLAWCGLAQFGPQKHKEKDQVFIYLNRKASLYDTTTSEPAYNKVTDKEYHKLTFVFNSEQAIHDYWSKAYSISVNTKLNLKRSGQRVTIYDPHSKPELTNVLKSKTPEQAKEDDTGEIPGDRRGAAGFDSSLWVHIAKNWYWGNQNNSRVEKSAPSLELRKKRLEKVLSKNLSYAELRRSNKVYLHKNPKGKETKAKVRKYVHVPQKLSKTVQKIVRFIPSRPKTAKMKCHDYIDKMILKRIGNIRAKWNDREDSILLMCMVANRFLCPSVPKKQVISYTTVRDVLHKLCPESKNKTSTACNRRMRHHLLRRYSFIEENISNIFQIKPILHYYSPLYNSLTKQDNNGAASVKYSSAQLAKAFIILMSYLVKHQDHVMDILRGNTMHMDHLAENRLEFTENNLISLDDIPQKYNDAMNVEDINKNVIKAAIHSFLIYRNKIGGNIQLFKIYQKYSDNLIREAHDELRASQMISTYKEIGRKSDYRWHTPFRLSSVYVFTHTATFSVTTAIQTYSTFLNLKENNKFLDFSQEKVEWSKYGQLLGINEFCTFWENVRFEFYLPETMVVLNPDISDHSELIDELANLWQTKLKKTLQDNSDGDMEQDTESENRSNLQDFEADTTSRDNDDTSEVEGLDYGRHPQIADSNNQDNPLDLTVETGNSETINRLKTWVTDCMEAERERRSPSPEFMNVEDKEEEGRSIDKSKRIVAEPEESFDDVDMISKHNFKKMLAKERMPSLEEIKEGMLKYQTSKEERIVPYITDLCSLLNKDLSDCNLDDAKLERLKSHFITQYPILENIGLGETEQLKHFWLVEHIEGATRNKQVWEKILSKLEVKKPDSMSEVCELLKKENADQRDFVLVNSIINFVIDKNSLGATSVQIKEHFRRSEENCSLETILQTLVDTGIFLRTGICSLTFVHNLYQTPWVAETFKISNEEEDNIQKSTSSTTNVGEDINKQLKEKTPVSVLIMPWIKIDGTLNEEVFKLWLCNVLSHCLDYPQIMFSKLCEKFCYVRPVDIFYLVEILKDLGCIELYTYEDKNKHDFYSEWEYIQEREATFLDNFYDMYITPTSLSMTFLGSFYYNNLK